MTSDSARTSVRRESHGVAGGAAVDRLREESFPIRTQAAIAQHLAGFPDSAHERMVTGADASKASWITAAFFGTLSFGGKFGGIGGLEGV